MRQYEDAGEAAGEERWAYYAVENATGQFAGLTDITIRPSLPDRVFVGDTGVDPAHRGRGLGKWLKAAITRRILDELPPVRWVITWNAGSNDAMLAINRQLGFRPAVIGTTWQVATSALRARLAGPSRRRALTCASAALRLTRRPGSHMLDTALCSGAVRQWSGSRAAVLLQAAAGHAGQASHESMAFRCRARRARYCPAIHPCPYPESTYT